MANKTRKNRRSRVSGGHTLVYNVKSLSNNVTGKARQNALRKEAESLMSNTYVPKTGFFKKRLTRNNVRYNQEVSEKWFRTRSRIFDDRYEGGLAGLMDHPDKLLPLTSDRFTSQILKGERKPTRKWQASMKHDIAQGIRGVSPGTYSMTNNQIFNAAARRPGFTSRIARFAPPGFDFSLLDPAMAIN